MNCYRHTGTTVVDRHGITHSGDLFTQLSQALGIEYADCPPIGTRVCRAAAYDCRGPFFDARGVPMRVPLLPSAGATDEDLKGWKASIAEFYRGAYTDTKGQQQLSLGKADLCTSWAAVYFRKDPDPSLLQALTQLQQMGAESIVGQDTVWLAGIVTAGAAHSCPTPPISASNDKAWLVPAEQAKSFYTQFRDCAAPDVNRVGGCPHSFDARDNHVNARYLFETQTPEGRALSLFLGD